MTISRRKPPALLTNITSVTAMVVCSSDFFLADTKTNTFLALLLQQAYSSVTQYNTTKGKRQARRVKIRAACALFID